MEKIRIAIDSNVYQKLLISISHTMLKTTTKDEFFKIVLKEIGINAKASRVFIFEHLGEQLWRNTYEWCADNAESAIDDLQNVHADDIMFFFKEVYAGNPFVFEDVNDINDKTTCEFLASQNILSLCIIPIFHDNKVFAFFGIDMCEFKATWGKETIDLLVAIANLISVAIGHYQIKNKLEQQTNEFKNILDSFPDPVYIADIDNYKLLFCNKVARDFFPNTDITDITCHKLFENSDAPCSFCSNINLKEDPTPIPWTHHNETLNRTFHLVDSCVEWQGRKQARFTVAHDITDILVAEQREKSATEAHASKNYFLTNMSHELLTPLNGILGLVYLTKSNCIDAKTNAYLSKINASTNTLLSIINNILECANLDSKAITIKNSPMTIQSVLQNVMNALKYSAAQKGLVLSCNIDDNLTFNVSGDFSRLTQVIMNLVLNAIKFTNRGKITIACNVKEKTDIQATIEIIVQDSGIGIEKTFFESIFEIFNQSDNSLTRKYGGIGMGLAISHKVIMLMGGKIDIVSVVDKGSTFTVTIPFFIAHEKVAINKAYNICQVKNLKNIRILVVEDNEINQLIIEGILEKEECHVDIAYNGEQAISMVEKSNYDIVLMDIQMPIMDGITATKHIRKKFSRQELPIVALTAHSLDSDKMSSFEAGMQEHITKPIDIENLVKTLIECLNDRYSLNL